MSIDNEIIGVVIIPVIGLIWAVFTFVVPHYQKVLKLRKEEEKRSLGPYSNNVIEDAAKYYVRPRCSKSDPTQILYKNISEFHELDLFSEVEKFIEDVEQKKFLLILADSGMGKTSFVLNYYYNNKKRVNRRRHKVKLVSLSIPNAETYLIDGAIDYEETVVFLDAFDEDTKAITNYQERLLQLLRLCFRYKKVIITCRSQFFIRESDIPSITDIPMIGAAYAGSRKQYEIARLYLLPFSDEDINIFLKKRYPRLNKEKKTISDINRIKNTFTKHETYVINLYS